MTPAPGLAPEALLIVAHGDCGGVRDNRLAATVAARMARTGRFGGVGIGYIRTTPDLAAAAAALEGDLVRVYPLFMSDGYYVSHAIPERLEIADGGADPRGRRFTIMQPTGLSPRLPAIVAGLARTAAKAAGLAPAVARLLIVAHGSTKDPASRLAAEAAAAAIAGTDDFAAVDAAFLDEAPFLADRLAALPGPLIVSGLFIGEGLHGAEDMEAAVAATGRRDLHLAPPLARARALIDAICADITAPQPAARQPRKRGSDPPRSLPR